MTKEETKWTPGRWAFSNDGVPTVWAGTSHIVTAFPTRTACEDRLDGESWIDMYDRTQPERDKIAAEAEANAHLIAAAPDLFEALNYVALSGKFECFDDTGWDIVNTALLKAKGEDNG